PVIADRMATWLASPQITQYACHVLSDGTLLGDRQNAEMTLIAKSMGGKPPGQPGRFDLLPYFVRDRKDRRIMFEVSRRHVREINIAHPTCAAITSLGLRWYAVPMVSNMIL